MVAEKHSIAKTIAYALAPNPDKVKEKSVNYNRKLAVYEYVDKIFDLPAKFIVTSVKGHVFSRDFPKKISRLV